MSWASRRASASIWAMSWRLASSAVRPAIPSSLRRCSSRAVDRRASFATTVALPLDQRPLAVLRLRLAPVQLVEPTAQLLFLLQDATFDLLELLLAGPTLLVQLGANLQRQLLGFQLPGAGLGLGLPDLGFGLPDLDRRPHAAPGRPAAWRRPGFCGRASRHRRASGRWTVSGRNTRRTRKGQRPLARGTARPLRSSITPFRPYPGRGQCTLKGTGKIPAKASEL